MAQSGRWLSVGLGQQALARTMPVGPVEPLSSPNGVHVWVEQ